MECVLKFEELSVTECLTSYGQPSTDRNPEQALGPTLPEAWKAFSFCISSLADYNLHNDA